MKVLDFKELWSIILVIPTKIYRTNRGVSTVAETDVRFLIARTENFKRVFLKFNAD